MPLFAVTPEVRDGLMTIAVAAASAIPCALLGCFLLLKRMSLLADGVGHGVLPGIALAVLFADRFGGWFIDKTEIASSVSGPHVMIGATIFGVLTAVITEWLASRPRVSSDASLGVVFTALFALGVVLLSMPLRNVHLDMHCISFSELELTPLRTTDWWGLPVPKALAPLLGVFAVVALVLTVFWKEFKLATFDPGLARSLGRPVRALHYLLVSLTAAATVAAFQSFGSILVLGMFVVPPATARLLTDRLATMLFLSAGLAASACVIGYIIASPEVLGGNASGMIVLIAGAQLAIAFFLAPRHGVLAHLARRWRLTERMAEEEILASLYRAEESHKAPAAPRDHAFSPTIIALARWNLDRKKLVSATNLTEQGRKRAQSIIRAHRLWEAYLEKNFELPLDHLHASATEIEHFLGPELQARLAAELDGAKRDPHGRSIPPTE
jgi:manganese/zinc/iron transport system permease protein